MVMDTGSYTNHSCRLRKESAETCVCCFGSVILPLFQPRQVLNRRPNSETPLLPGDGLHTSNSCELQACFPTSGFCISSFSAPGLAVLGDGDLFRACLPACLPGTPLYPSVAQCVLSTPTSFQNFHMELLP